MPGEGFDQPRLDLKSILDSLSPCGEIGLVLIIFAETGLLLGSSSLATR